MQIIIVDHQRGRTRHLQLPMSRLRWLVGAAVALVLGIGLLAGLGGWSLHGAAAPGEVQLIDVRAEDVERQRQELAELRTRLRDESLAFARRIAVLQAHVTRIDAAGERMTRLAKLDDGEFDFASTPAVGGPVDEQQAEASALSDLADELDALEARIDSRARQIAVLEDLLVSSHAREQSRPEGLPVTAGFISSGFGSRTDPFTGRRASHYGVDFAARTGTEVSAVGSGIVQFAGYRKAYGRMIEVNHGNGYLTRYGHNSKLLVSEGERVTRGQVIAEVGASGRATGPHLHFEVWRGDKPVNPMRYIQAAR